MHHFKHAVNKINKDKDATKQVYNEIINGVSLPAGISSKKHNEILSLARFINSINEEIEVLECREAPDFVVSWQGVKFGLELTQFIDKEKIREAELTKRLLANVQESYLKLYGDIKKLINVSLKFTVKDIITSTAMSRNFREIKKRYPVLSDQQIKNSFLICSGEIDKASIPIIAKYIADKIHNSYVTGYHFIDDDLISHVSFQNYQKTEFSLNKSWVVGSADEGILVTLKQKEAKLKDYVQSTATENQCLLILVEGSSGYSDYSSLSNSLLESYNTQFTTVMVFNIFTNEVITLKR